MKIIWHYTTVEDFETILVEKRLRPSKLQRASEARPPIWLSKQKFWDPTFAMMAYKKNKLTHLTMRQQYKLTGLVRIGIAFSDRFLSWENYKHAGLRNFFLLMTKERAAIKAGARTSDWFCSLKSVPPEDWIKIEKFDGVKWVRIKEIKIRLGNPSIQTPTVTDGRTENNTEFKKL